jgi:hypothetical protein
LTCRNTLLYWILDEGRAPSALKLGNRVIA